MKVLKPGAVGLGMGGVAPGEILPSEEHVQQPQAIKAASAQRPLLLTDGKHAEPITVRAADAAKEGADSKADSDHAERTAASAVATAAESQCPQKEARAAPAVASAVQPVLLDAEMLGTVD